MQFACGDIAALNDLADTTTVIGLMTTIMSERYT